MNSYPLVAGLNNVALTASNGYNILFDATHLGFAANRIKLTVNTGSAGDFLYALPNGYLSDTSGTITTRHLFTSVNTRTNAKVSYSFVLDNIVVNETNRSDTNNTNMPVRPGDYLQVTTTKDGYGPDSPAYNYTALIVDAVKPLSKDRRIVLCSATKATSITDATCNFLLTSDGVTTATVSLTDPAYSFTVVGASAASAGTAYFTARLNSGVNLTTLATTPEAKRPKVDGEKFNLCGIDHIKTYGICLESARTDGSNILDTSFYDVRSGTGIYHGIALYASANVTVNIQVYNAF